MLLKVVTGVFANISKAFGVNNQLRFYSRYPKYYVDPLTDKNEVEEFVKSKEELELQNLNIKAASNYATCSVLFNSDVHLLSQYLMRNGNRILAKRLVNETFQHIKRVQLSKYNKESSKHADKIEINPTKIFLKAVENCTPVLITKKVKRSGTFYNVPTVLLPRKAKFLAMKFLIESANEKNKDERFVHHLAQELILASENKGKAVQKKVDLHRHCEANRAYSHYRWT